MHACMLKSPEIHLDGKEERDRKYFAKKDNRHNWKVQSSFVLKALPGNYRA